MATVTSLGFSLFARNNMKPGLDSAARDVETWADRIIARGKRLSETFAPIAAGAGAAAGAALSAGITHAVNLSEAQTLLQAQLGLAADDAEVAGTVAGDVFARGFGESLDQVADAIAGVHTNIGALGDLTASELEEMTVQALSLARAFDQDVSQATVAAGQLMKTGLAANATEAFDLLTAGFQAGLDRSGDFLDTIVEYSTQFRDLGLSGEQALGLISQGLQAGARDADMVADALKEFSIEAVAGSERIASAWEELGLDADTMFARIGAGGESAAAALDLTLDALRDVEDPIERGALAVELFGTKAEDLGDALYALDPSAAALDNVAGSAAELSQTIEDSPVQQFQAAWRGLVDTISNEVLPHLTGLANWLADNPKTVGVATAALAGLLGVLLVVSTVVGPLITTIGVMAQTWTALRGAVSALNVTLLASPWFWLVLGIAALIAIVIVCWNKFDGFRDAVLAVWDSIQAGWESLWDGVLKPGLDALLAWWDDTWPTIKSTATEVWDEIVSYAEEIWPKIEEIFDQVKTIVTGALDEIERFWDDHGDTIMMIVDFFATTVGGRLGGMFTIIGAIVQGAWQMIKGIISGALDVIKGILDIFIGVVTGDWERAWDGVKSVFSGLWTAIEGILQGAITILGGIFDGLVETVKAPFQWIYNWLVGKSLIPDLVNSITGWFTRLRDKAAEIFAMVRDWIVARVTALYYKAKAVVMTIVSTVVMYFYGLRNQARDVWDTIRNWITDRASTLRDRVVSAVTTLKNKVIDAFERARDGVKRVWDKLKDAAKTPVRFVIETVYNSGIVPLWNKIADKVPGISALKTMKLPKGFRRGGILPGHSSWRQGDSLLVPMRPGEGVYVAEAMRDPYERARLHAVNQAALRGQDLSRFRDVPVDPSPANVARGQPPYDLPGYARGGIVGEWLSTAWSSIVGGIRDWASAPLRALRTQLRDRFGSGQNIQAVPYHMYRVLETKILDRFGAADDAYAAMAAGGASGWRNLGAASARLRRAAQWSLRQAGKPYVWGGAGPHGYDCSGFIGALENVIRGVGPYFRRYSTHAFRGGSAPDGWVRNLVSPFMIGITHAGVGHTAGTLMGVNVESRGSAGVVVGPRARGAKNRMFTSTYGFAPVLGDATATPVFDQGGVLAPGVNLVENRTGAPEPLVRPDQLAERREYHITVQVGPGTPPADVGKRIVEYIQAYEKRSGARWRRT
ncbi:MAG: phage tail tape measure protein [Limnochordales bacterium]